jgi:Bromodomain/Bromodomain extra-terminal - transcription regulation
MMNFKPLFLNKLNKLLPSRYQLAELPKKRFASKDASYTVRDSSKVSRKKYKTRQKEKICVNQGSEWTDRDWGLKVGGEAAQKCYELLQNLKKHSLAGPFLQPVDPVALNLPDYLEVVMDPVDLSAIERNLKSGYYQNSLQFATDIRRIWLNSFTYNATDSDMFYITLEMATYFEKLFREYDSLLFTPGKELKHIPVDKNEFKDYMNKPMTLQQKKILAANLRRLNPQQVKKVFAIINGSKSLTKNFQINVAKFTPRVCRELEKYIKLSYQTSLHANRQRSPSAIKRQYQLDMQEIMPEKRQKTREFI